MKNYIVAEQGDHAVHLAAKELRRYLYVLGEELPEIVSSIPEEGNCMILAVKGHGLLEKYTSVLDYTGLGEEGYLLYGREKGMKIFTGNTGISVLYAVYRFLELQGIGFYLHGDVIPDKKCRKDIWGTEPDIRETPLFRERGILPFHDFPEGPDWWNKDDYYAVLTQLAKMRANFFALHTYPENQDAPKAMTAEPLVWIGKKEDCREDGTVKASYPVQHFKTNGNSWGYHPMDTGDYPCGTGNVFETDSYGADYMKGYEEDIYSTELHENMVPADKYNQMFHAYGQLLQDTFSYAKEIGVKTCIGTEAPLTIPETARHHLAIDGEADEDTVEALYEGIFERIKRLHPLDYYWMWTPEDWTWLGNTKEDTHKTIRDFACALKAKERTEAPFELAVCGWTLGPREDRAAFDNYLPKSMPFSCINRNVGFDPIEPKFQDLKGRPAWAIPWMEDDPAMISPQLWAGRMRRDAFDAKRYHCSGLLGIHWRTRNIAPNAKALMESAWDQPWGKELDGEISLEGYIGKESYAVRYPDGENLSATARKGMSGYQLNIPAGNYTVQLDFRPDTAKLDIKVNHLTLRDLEINEEHTRILVPGMEVEQDTSLRITFFTKEGSLALTAIEILGATKNNQLSGNDFSRKINCGGEAWKDYEADLPLHKENGRYAPVRDFYERFSAIEFGDRAGSEAARILTEMDGHLPRPSRWEDGPGNIYQNDIPWEEMQSQYKFTEQFEQLGKYISGEGEKERFDYWNHTFQAMKKTAELGCLWGSFEKQYKVGAQDAALDVYRNIVRTIEVLDFHLLMALQTYGDMGVLANIQQRSVVPILKDCQSKLGNWYVELPKLKENVLEAASKLVVPTVRTSLKRGESLKLKTIVLGGSDNAPVIYFRKLGEEKYKEITFEKLARWVYILEIPADELQADFEYHICLEHKGKSLEFPRSSRCKNQTVIVME